MPWHIRFFFFFLSQVKVKLWKSPALSGSYISLCPLEGFYFLFYKFSLQMEADPGYSD